ncbi:hypothetical protein N8T08_003620 [Aspergillus melleus]|uniref:Uncharacterized protein n=1 Tax=Aspergillus melleus TaxID=138277 RepID=A0ACC3B640_9EURO|nr:hypothetical protein N8T08_003620 [Aspergillus melleus]
MAPSRAIDASSSRSPKPSLRLAFRRPNGAKDYRPGLRFLAIGALVSPLVGADDLSTADGWAEFFAQSVDIPMSALFELTLPLVHPLMLKAMRPNDTYMALGVAASVTLLYQVLDPATTVEYAKDTFTVIEQAIECLNCMERLGPRAAQKLSVELIQMAKNVLFFHTNQDEYSVVPDDSARLALS